MNEEEEKKNIPALSTPEELDAKRFAVLDDYWLQPELDYPEPFYMLEYNGVPFSTIGGVGAISGQKKNGKSFLMTQLMAAILDDGNGKTNRFLPGLRVPDRTIEYLREERKDAKHLPNVLYVDTEMEMLYSAKVLRRVHWLCGWDMKVRNDRFHVLWLKNMPKDGKTKPYKKRFELIQLAIDAVQPDIVFIDGIRDLLTSINDEDNATQVLDEFGRLAQEKKMCIWNALHQNPRGSGDGEEVKMRGWVGTELGNKCSDTLISIKKKDAQTGQVTFTVKQMDARGKDLEDWKFEVTDDAGNLGIPKILRKASTSTQDEAEERRKIDDLFKQYQWHRFGDTYTDLERHLYKCGITSNRKISDVFSIARESGIIFKDEKKRYFYKGIGTPLPEETDELPFGPPEEQDKF